MMNVLALGLLISSIAAAGIWSPNPQHQHHPQENDNVILREGHRVIVVEYEIEGIQKPISVSSSESSPLPQNLENPLGLVEEAKEKFKEAASVLTNLGQGVSPPVHSSKEKICDAYGACKERVSGIFSKAKEKLADGILKAESVGKDVVHSGEIVTQRVKDVAGDVAHGSEAIVEKAKDGIGSVVDSSETFVEKAKRAGENLAEKSKSFGEELKRNSNDVTKTTLEEVKGKAKEAQEMAENVVDEVKSKVKGKGKEAQEMAENVVDEVKSVGEKSKSMVSDTLHKQHQNLTDIVRRGRNAAYNAAAYALSADSLTLLMSVVHLIVFAVAYGVCVWMTFVSSYVLARVLSRQQFGVVQSKIYPVYFRMMAYGVGLSLLSYFFSRGRRVGDGLAKMLECYNLLVSLGLVLANMFYLEPRATKVMYERLKLEKEEGKGGDISDMVVEPVVTADTTTTTTAGSAGNVGVNATMFTATATATATTPGRAAQQEVVKLRAVKLSRRLKNLNAYSSFLNIMTLMSLTWHVVHLGKCLHMSC
ncbi:uncharacterized protein LOC131235288 [Magnolia sinica]|uniref:uncharacterized protein LOC131235288 n=1 Tax=Magnolia sinica TaxID=86752 RepID=UPI002658832F|nr:uncharacterized protein LOC131235288 [Magnolia sinica]